MRAASTNVCDHGDSEFAGAMRGQWLRHRLTQRRRTRAVLNTDRTALSALIQTLGTVLTSGAASFSLSLRKWCLVLIGLIAMLLSGCDTTYTWKEEVKLTNGMVAIVERSQTRAFRDPLTREGGYSKYFTLELTDPVPVKWADSLAPIAFDIDSVSPIIVIELRGGPDCTRFGNPSTQFVALRSSAFGNWNVVPLDSIPEAVRLNLLIDPFRGEVYGRPTPVSFGEKELWNRGVSKALREFNPRTNPDARPCITGPIKY